jgi:hypothetical protein
MARTMNRRTIHKSLTAGAVALAFSSLLEAADGQQVIVLSEARTCQSFGLHTIIVDATRIAGRERLRRADVLTWS